MARRALRGGTGGPRAPAGVLLRSGLPARSRAWTGNWSWMLPRMGCGRMRRPGEQAAWIDEAPERSDFLRLCLECIRRLGRHRPAGTVDHVIPFEWAHRSRRDEHAPAVRAEQHIRREQRAGPGVRQAEIVAWTPAPGP